MMKASKKKIYATTAESSIAFLKKIDAKTTLVLLLNWTLSTLYNL